MLGACPPTARGAVFLEVPIADDILPRSARRALRCTWLPRESAPAGRGIHAAVLAHLGESRPAGRRREIDPDLWETPTYSSSGEDVDAAVRVSGTTSTTSTRGSRGSP